MLGLGAAPDTGTVNAWELRSAGSPSKPAQISLDYLHKTPRKGGSVTPRGTQEVSQKSPRGASPVPD